MSAPADTIYRHTLLVRLTHWVNAFVMPIMLMSGLLIFNEHPALYWGEISRFDQPAFAMKAVAGPDGALRGITRIGAIEITTTGLFGVSKVDGVMQRRAFPAYVTLPTTQWLAMGRLWHFFFAWFFVTNGLIYIGYSLWRRHAQKDLIPGKGEWKRIPRVIWDHLRLRFPKGEDAKTYNVLQKLAYFGVAFVLGPLVVLTGLTMSPALNTSFPFMLDIFGGRQSARTIHFLCAAGFFSFFTVHLAMVLLSGAGNNIRSMITGFYQIKTGDRHHG